MTAIVDSGTSLCTGPTKEIAQLAAAVGATKGFTGQYTVDCATIDDLPDIVFTIGGKDYVIPGKAAILQVGLMVGWGRSGGW
jgi:hypothetical protein